MYLSPPPISRGYDLTEEQIESYAKNTKDYGFDFIKILSIKNQEIFENLDRKCKEMNIPLSGHFPRLASGNYLPEELFFNSNYNCIEHLGGMLVEPSLLEERKQALLTSDIYLCPTLSWYSIGSGRYSIEELPELPGMRYIKPETMNEWITKTKEDRAKLGEEAFKEEVANELNTLEQKYKVIKQLQDAGVKMLLSPDASGKYMIPGFDMVHEMELLKNANLSNFLILQMATTNFSDFF